MPGFFIKLVATSAGSTPPASKWLRWMLGIDCVARAWSPFAGAHLEKPGPPDARADCLLAHVPARAGPGAVPPSMATTARGTLCQPFDPQAWQRASPLGLPHAAPCCPPRPLGVLPAARRSCSWCSHRRGPRLPRPAAGGAEASQRQPQVLPSKIMGYSKCDSHHVSAFAGLPGHKCIGFLQLT